MCKGLGFRGESFQGLGMDMSQAAKPNICLGGQNVRALEKLPCCNVCMCELVIVQQMPLDACWGCCVAGMDCGLLSGILPGPALGRDRQYDTCCTVSCKLYPTNAHIQGCAEAQCGV